MGNILVTDVQVPPQAKPIVGSSPKPRAKRINPNIVSGYNHAYHSACLFHDGEVCHSDKFVLSCTLKELDKINKIPDIIKMAHDFGLYLKFTPAGGGVEVFVALPEHPSSLLSMMRFDTYAGNLVMQVAYGTLFEV